MTKAIEKYFEEYLCNTNFGTSKFPYEKNVENLIAFVLHEKRLPDSIF